MAIVHTKRKQTCIYKWTLPCLFQNFNVEYFILSILAVFYLLNTSFGSPHLNKEIISWRHKNMSVVDEWSGPPDTTRHQSSACETYLTAIVFSFSGSSTLKILINNLYLNFNHFTIFYIQYNILSTSNWASDVKPLFSSSSQPIWLQTGNLYKYKYSIQFVLHQLYYSEE